MWDDSVRVVEEGGSLRMRLRLPLLILIDPAALEVGRWATVQSCYSCRTVKVARRGRAF